MAKKPKLTLAPKKPSAKLKKILSERLKTKHKKAKEKRLYKPKVRLTAHINKTI